MKRKKFLISERLRSFRFAFNGLKVLFQREHNSRIHLTAGVAAIIAGFFFHISTAEWLALIIVIGIVFITEIFNSALEHLCDFVSPEYHLKIKDIKDLSAAAALASAIIAVAAGLLIFLPKIFF